MQFLSISKVYCGRLFRSKSTTARLSETPKICWMGYALAKSRRVDPQEYATLSSSFEKHGLFVGLPKQKCNLGEFS